MSTEQTEATSASAIPTKRNIAELLGRRRMNLDRDGHIADDRVSYVREDDGHKIGKVVKPKKGTNGTKEVDRDLTATEGAAPSTTTRAELIVQEAKLVDGGRPIKNPHIPSNDGVLETALERLAEKGLAPAWEVVDGGAEVTNG